VIARATREEATVRSHIASTLAKLRAPDRRAATRMFEEGAAPSIRASRADA
jgi:DNA-binding NarL/FixJ family response regulator